MQQECQPRITYSLRYPEFIDPFMMRSLERVHKCIIIQPDYIEIGNNRLFAVNPPLRVGEAVLLRIGRMFVELEYESDHQAWLQAAEREREAKQAEKARQAAERQQQQIDLSKAFYAHYDVPFRFTIEVKEVLSGLSANSNGDGQRRNTVKHLFVQDGFTKGRLKRNAGDYLCSPSQARSGGNWSNNLGRGSFALDEEGTQPIPTCKQCLTALERFKRIV